jgi:Holliday junction resolvase RusA-like endonuclease
MITEIEDVICFTVPLRVPSVNHIWETTMYTGKDGFGHRGRKLSKEAKAFYAAVSIFAQRRTVAPSTDKDRRKAQYVVDVDVWFGPKQRGDVDNQGKALLDSLVKCGVIHSDANVVNLNIKVHKDERDDPQNPRVQFIVERL